MVTLRSGERSRINNRELASGTEIKKIDLRLLIIERQWIYTILNRRRGTTRVPWITARRTNYDSLDSQY